MPASFDNEIQDVLAALVTLVGNFTDPNGGSVTADDDMLTTGITDAQLPFAYCRHGRMLARQEIATDLFNDTRQYQVIVYVEKLDNGELQDESQFDNANKWIKPFHKYLAQNRSLTQGAYMVIADVRDSGTVSLFAKDGLRYAGVAFTIPIQQITRF